MNNTQSNQYQLTTWFYVYRALIIPGIIFSLLIAFSGNFLYFVDAIMLIILYIGLYQRKLWAWEFNFFALILSTIGRIINAIDRAGASGISAGTGFIIGLIIFGAYAYFNWDYFAKRKHLFEGGKSLDNFLSGLAGTNDEKIKKTESDGLVKNFLTKLAEGSDEEIKSNNSNNQSKLGDEEE